MNKQTILIYDFDALFDILIEIKQNFKFDILDFTLMLLEN